MDFKTRTVGELTPKTLQIKSWVIEGASREELTTLGSKKFSTRNFKTFL